MLSGEFAGDYDDFYRTLEGEREGYSGTFTYKGRPVRCEEPHGAEAVAVIEKHVKNWL